MEDKKKPRVKREYHLLSYQDPTQIEVCIDECARGCGFGSTFIGAVVLPPNFEELMKSAHVIVRDSKKMSAKQREKAFHFIKEHALAYSIVSKDNKRIDEINILQAVMEAMHEAIDNVRSVMEVDKILVDGDKFIPYYKDKDTNTNKQNQIPHECVIEGDGTYYGIAAASILAKHAHDTWIHELVEQYPELKEYDIQNNQGYLTAKHLAKIREKIAAKEPLSPWHRLSFGICRESVGSGFAPREKKEKKAGQMKITDFKFTDSDEEEHV